jgi:hypothetical protein
MIFKRTQQRYGRTPAPETPYQRAGQMWDERIGSAREQARNWRLMAFGGLLLSSALATGLLWQSVQSRVVPYVVEVDRLGAAQSIAAVGADYQPTDPQIAWHLAKFIANVRGLSLDPADKANVHSWRLLKGIALSTLLGVGTQLTFGTGESDLVRAIRESTQQNADRAGQQLVSKNFNIQPTITVRPGWPLRVVVHKDIVLRPWSEWGGE